MKDMKLKALLNLKKSILISQVDHMKANTSASLTFCRPSGQLSTLDSKHWYGGYTCFGFGVNFQNI